MEFSKRFHVKGNRLDQEVIYSRTVRVNNSAIMTANLCIYCFQVKGSREICASDIL